MFTWTCKSFRFWQVFPILFLLSACAELGAGLPFFGAPVNRASVAGGNVVIAGPPGYCVDRSALSTTPKGDFVLLASCASISGNPAAPAPGIPAILTASVATQPVANIDRSLDRLTAFFKSDKGRAALARDGRASSVEVLSTRVEGGALVMKVRDTGFDKVVGLEPEYWRALFDLEGRIVTLSVITFSDKPMSDDEAMQTIMNFMDRVHRANPTAAGPVES